MHTVAFYKHNEHIYRAPLKFMLLRNPLPKRAKI